MNAKTLNARDARTWHLTPTEESQTLSGAEFGLLRTLAAFQRANINLSRLATGLDLSFSEIVILHLVRMQERPKDAATIGTLVNRDDLPNILYNLRKLVSLGLVRKFKNGGVTLFEVTERGRTETDRYAAIRRQLLLMSLERSGDIRPMVMKATDTLRRMADVYEAQTRDLATLDPSFVLAEETAQPDEAPMPRAPRTRSASAVKPAIKPPKAAAKRTVKPSEKKPAQPAKRAPKSAAKSAAHR